MKPFTLALGFAVALVSLNVAGHQEYPARSKIIKIVVPYPAGGPTNFVGRTVADALGKSLHKTVIVENKSGAGGEIGSDSVAKSAQTATRCLLGLVGECPLRRKSRPISSIRSRISPPSA